MGKKDGASTFVLYGAMSAAVGVIIGFIFMLGASGAEYAQQSTKNAWSIVGCVAFVLFFGGFVLSIIPLLWEEE